MESLIDLHHDIMFFLVLTAIFVLYMLLIIVYKFRLYTNFQNTAILDLKNIEILNKNSQEYWDRSITHNTLAVEREFITHNKTLEIV